ncbi:MAG: AAA family ATPase [Elusimicrobia bacterium]|nr:AAA family ATPase [Elusimicrobiota bacterium]
MYLKAIELQGFKSFSSKVKFPLKPGITCIIGPNGCGKSNVVDSIRWCIGEMSWKSLRLPSMMDVIFTGTAKRPALSMAEVNMTFDNEERKLPLDFKEITVTRKIYRSDESEYFINRVQCRLKDIREMFLDTGIGSDGYAIIDQGEVESVLAATPQQRREMFEEASGVSKYKSKREEAIRKLEKVDLDLGRLADSMTLINDQLKKLSSDAKKALLQQKYKEELKSAEIAMFSGNIKGYRNSISLANEKLKPINEEISEISSNIIALDAESSALNLNLTEKSEDERALREDIAAVKSNKVAIEGKVIGSENMIEQINKQLSDLAVSEDKNKVKLEDINPQLESLNEKLNQAKDSFSALKSEFEAIAGKEKDLGIEIADISDEISKKEDALVELYQRRNNASAEMAKIESNIAHLKEDVLSANADLEKLNLKKNELERNASEIKEKILNATDVYDEKLSALLTMEADKKNLEEKIKQTELRLAQVKTDKAISESRLETILKQGAKDSYWVGINHVLNADLKGVKGTLRHIITVRKEDMVMVEEAFGKFMDSIVCDTLENAQEAIKYLKHIGKGRCRFIVLDRLSAVEISDWDVPNAVKIMDRISCPDEYQPMISHLLKNIYISDGSVLSSFWISGGIREIDSNEPYWEEEGALKEKIKSLGEEETGLFGEREELEKNIIELNLSIDIAEKDVSSKQMEIEKMKNEAAQAEKEYSVNSGNIIFMESEIDKFQENIKTQEETLSDFTSKADELFKSEESFKNELSEQTLKKEALQAEFSKLKEDIGSKRSTVSNYEDNVINLKDEIGRTEDFRKHLISEKENFAVKKEELYLDIENLKNDIESSQKNLSEVMSEFAKKEVMESQISTEINDLKNKYDGVNSQIRNAKEVFSDLEKKSHEIELAISGDSARMDDLGRRLIDDWNISEEEAVEKYGNIEVDADRAQFLKKRIENMGPVNMTAPQEHEALITRYNFMNSQVEDLNIAKSNLKSAISRINETTRENFKNTFDKVKIHFSQIYGMLFSGGEANLMLTMPDNLLETGVEIMANPPGKKPISISQLSGGEKALTALALLFSFFCVNPSPFCVMDEADAALDDANVERFVRLIKEFSKAMPGVASGSYAHPATTASAGKQSAKTTQFIVITHNKKTMEAADVLYGVTMEEPGISKLISVDLKKASSFVDSSIEPVSNKSPEAAEVKRRDKAQRARI